MVGCRKVPVNQVHVFVVMDARQYTETSFELVDKKTVERAKRGLPGLVPQASPAAPAAGLLLQPELFLLLQR